MRTRIGSPVSGLLLFCYDYDAATGKYTLSIVRLTRVLGVATVLALGSFLFVMFRRDWVRRRGEAPGAGDPAGQGDPADAGDPRGPVPAT